MYKITNKKTFVIFIGSILLIVCVISGGVYYFSKKNNGKSQEKVESSQGIEVGSDREMENDDVTETVLNNEEKADNNVNEPENNEDGPREVIEYQNTRYKFSTKFPIDWYVDTGSSESPIVEKNIDEEMVVKVGGQTFWSNYDNIDQYTPQNKPDNFYLLGLAVYDEDPAMPVDDFVKKTIIGEDFTDIVINDFKGVQMEGRSYYAESIVEDNPIMLMVYRRDGLFYVFKASFVGGNNDAIEIVSNIAKSFKLQ